MKRSKKKNKSYTLGERATEDEMVRWHHLLNGHKCEQTPGDGKGQGSLANHSPWAHEEPDMTAHLNNSSSP